jgi:hypothetical protein
MNNSSSKKLWELRYMKKFVESAGLNEEVIEIQEGPEPPDCVLRLKNGTNVGVEITKLINQEIKWEEAVRRKVIEDAEVLYIQSGFEEVEVLVTFMPLPISQEPKPRLTSISLEILNLVNVARLKGSETNLVEFERPFITSSHIDRISVLWESGFEGWQQFGAHKVDGIQEDDIESVLAKKDQRLEMYQSNYDQTWLLMVIPAGGKSSAFNFDGIGDLKVGARFNKVYAFREFDETFVTLK